VYDFRTHFHAAQQGLQNSRSGQAVGAKNVEKDQVEEVAVYKRYPVSLIEPKGKKYAYRTGD
jgi:hypothetical protein